jgi:hypothetical protein
LIDLMSLSRLAAPAVLVVLLLGALAAAGAEEARRFATSHITPQEWQTFYDEVRAKPGARDISRADVPSVTAIQVMSEWRVYYFTKPGWAAHPAVVIQQVVQMEDGTFIRTTGYFAGAEGPFAEWFLAFKQHNEEIRKTLRLK